MKHRTEKASYLMQHQGAVCATSGDRLPFHFELHHALCHDTKNNRKQFPLLIDSILNLVAVTPTAHAAHRSWGIRSYEYCQRVEAFLERHPKMADFVNNPEPDYL